MKLILMLQNILSLIVLVDCKCKHNVHIMQFALEYGLWRGWNQAVIINPPMNDGCSNELITFIKCLSLNGIKSAMNSDNLKKISSTMFSRLGVIIFGPPSNDVKVEDIFVSTLKELVKNNMHTESYDWLLLYNSLDEYENNNKILHKIDLRFDANTVGAYVLNNASYNITDDRLLCKKQLDKELDKNNYVKNQISNLLTKLQNKGNQSRIYKGKAKYNNCARRTNNKITNCLYKNETIKEQTDSDLTRFRTYRRHSKELNLFNTGIILFNYSNSFDMIDASSYNKLEDIKFRLEHKEIFNIVLMQYFKVRLNSTLYTQRLGYWSLNDSMAQVEIPYPVEARNFLGEIISIGRINITVDDRVMNSNPNADEDAPADISLLEDITEYLCKRLYAVPKVTYHKQLGYRSFDGSWSGLLGDVVDGTVDIAIEPANTHGERKKYMQFIIPVARTMRNIYIKEQETSAEHDIFLAPFHPLLLLSVISFIILLGLSLILICRLHPDLSKHSAYLNVSQSLLWCWGIMCQQGSDQISKTASTKLLLLITLMFALLIYNAYSAFITSLLSVRVYSINNVAAILTSSNIKIGYIKNGADQMYLMSTKDVNLNKFYIRGFSDPKNLVENAEEGLQRAASQDYAFFASQMVARSTLRSLSQEQGRCSIREVIVPSTKSDVSFPMPKLSPYTKPILISLLDLRTSGVLERLSQALVPKMPQCSDGDVFTGAHVNDVKSALGALVFGAVVSITFGISEYLWTRRSSIRNCITTLAKNKINEIFT